MGIESFKGSTSPLKVEDTREESHTMTENYAQAEAKVDIVSGNEEIQFGY